MTVHIRGKQCQIQRFHIFIFAVIFVKVALMGLFSSDYQNVMFMRFVHGFLGQLFDGRLVNPYEFFRDEPRLFPYPPLMLAVECLGGIPSLFAYSDIFLRNFFFKLPLLLFDCLGMRFLMQMFSERRKYVAILYFSSPIILYSTYMHGQLDIIPTVFLLGAVKCLTAKERNEARYVLLLGASLLCKFHILAVIPVLFLFVAKRDGWRKAVLLTASSLALAVLGVLPFWGGGFLYNVLLNSEQGVLVRIFFDFVGLKIYVPIMAVILIYLKMFTMGKVNRDLLYSLLGVLFSVFLAFVPPMPGWYVWIVPFITIFFVDVGTERHKNVAVFLALNVVYLLYFVFAHRTENVDLYFLGFSMAWLKVNSPLFVNGVFTVMTSLLVYSIYMMYQSGIASNSLYKRRNQSFAIGVAGDSGSGKSTFAAMVESIFGERNLLLLEGDGDHRWERGDTMWDQFTHLNPKSNYLYRQTQDLVRLKNGESVLRTDYDHETGQFTEGRKIRPKPYILLCGLHALYLPQTRRCLDVKVYMDVDETLRRYWKIQRDTKKRGYAKERILDQINARVSDAEKYVKPQKKYADLLVTYFDRDLADCMAEGHEVSLGLKVSLDMEIDLELLIMRLEDFDIRVSYDYDEDLMMQTATFEGGNLEGRSLPIAGIADELIPHLDEIIQLPLETEDDLHGILAIILLMLVSRKLQGGEDRPLDAVRRGRSRGGGLR